DGSFERERRARGIALETDDPRLGVGVRDDRERLTARIGRMRDVDESSRPGAERRERDPSTRERSVEIDPDDAGGAAAIREEIERKLAIRAAHEIDAEGERRLPLSRTAIAIERHTEPAQRRAL